jgi:hypothetical protein
LKLVPIAGIHNSSIFGKNNQVVRHIVIWRMNEREPEKLAVLCHELRIRLFTLKDQIPLILSMEVGINAPSAPDGNHDIVLVADFKGFEELRQYQEHPGHKELVNWLKGKRELRAAVDYEI